MSDASRGPVKAAPVAKAAPMPRLTAARGAVLQRKCACGGQAEGKCEKCRDEERTLQRKAADHRHAPASVPPIVHGVLSSPGRPLDPATRSFMEPRFGRDFSGVRLHTDGQAAESARAVDASAYTVGQHIVFGSERYAPHTEGGKHLLAHELAHTVQQGGFSALRPKLLTDSPDTPLEREADAVGERIVSGDTVAVRRSAGPSLQRKQMTCSEILEAPTDPRLEPKDLRKFGTAVDAYIKKDFRKKAGKKATKGLIIPGASSTAKKTEGCDPEEAPSVIEPEVTPSEEAPPARKGINLGGGVPDLVYREDRTVELAEVKAGTHTCVPLAEEQLKKYIDQGMAEDDPQVQWRKARKIDDIKVMSSARYQPSSPVQVMGFHTAVSWCEGSPGVIVYKAIAPSALVEAAGEPYDLNIAGLTVTINVLPAPFDTDLLNSGPQNRAVAESVPGVILKTLHRKRKGEDTVDAEIETASNSKSDHKSQVPVETAGEIVQVVYRVNRDTRQLALQTKKVRIPIKYKHLSTGVITRLEHSDETGLSGEGTIKPSIKLLEGLDIDFAFGQDFLEVKLSKKKPRIPIPGVEITEFNLALKLLPAFEPSGTIAFTIGTGKRARLDGVITVSADAEGFLAKGDVVAHIPGVDETKGTITYRPSVGWSGVINLTTSKIPYVQNASITVSFSDAGLALTGGLEIVLPGDQRVFMGVKKRSATQWVYTGRGEFKVPKLKPVVISFVYDGDDVTGSAATGFEYKGLEGKIDLVYENGVVTGKARLEINKSKGRLKGYLDVTLTKQRKFTGEGLVSYEIKPGLVASAGIIVDEYDKVTVVGSLTFPPYTLFERHPFPPRRINIFRFGPKDIPVPFLSIGPVGLQARIGAGMFLEYGIGPGVIKDGFIKAKVDPLEDNPDPEFELGGRISVPLSFGITGYVSGGLVLDVLIAEAGGKLVVSATAVLGGEGGARLYAKYSKEEFKAEVDVHLLLELILKFCVSAYVWAEAGVWRFKVRTSRSWNLLDFPYRPGFQLGIKGLKKPITYSSKTGFTLPSFDDIDWAEPNPRLDPQDALKSGIGAAQGQEDAGKPTPCPVIDED